MKRLRGGSGLGDSVYLRPIVDHLGAITVMSNYPDVFIGSKAKVEPFNRTNIDILAHYSTERAKQYSTQYADMLRCARLPDIPLRFSWSVRNRVLVERLQSLAGERPVIVVHGGRPPFGRTDGVGAEILPRQKTFLAALDGLEDCFIVRIGKGPKNYDLPSSLDLYGQTSVSDLLDLVSICDGVVTQCGYPIPMAECLDKPLLAIWSARGLAAPDPTIASVTPAKILTKHTSGYVMDTWTPELVAEVSRFTLLEKIAA